MTAVGEHPPHPHVHIEGLALRVREVTPTIIPHIIADLPNESVGFVWREGVSHMRNQAASPHRFTLSATRVEEEYARHRHTFPQFMYHSHPKGSAGMSEEDWRSLRINWNEGFCVPWVVYAVEGGMGDPDLARVTRFSINIPSESRVFSLDI